MNFEQAAILLLLGGMLIVFALDRLRVEIVAASGLGIGVALGLVMPAEAFSGLSNPAFVTVVEILLIVPVLSRSGILDPLARRIPDIVRTETGILVLLCSVTASISVFMNNIGALALMIPVVSSICRVSGLDQRRILMPISFAALLGGLCSVIGTPANLIVSNQLAAVAGKGFGFFDFAWAGVPAALVGIVVLLIWPRHVLGASGGDPGDLVPQSFGVVISEVEVGMRSPLIGELASELGVTIHALRRAGPNLFFQRPGTRIEPGDVLLIEIDLPRLDSWLAEGTVHLPQGARGLAGSERIEVVVMPQSTFVGSRVGALDGLSSRDIRVVAVAARTPRIEGSLADLQLSIGDVLHLVGDRQAIREIVDEAEVLPLWPREEAARIRRWRPVVVFAAGVALAAFGHAPPEMAFGLATLVLAATGDLSLRRGLAELDWPTLIMLATMIPLGIAVETTGSAAAIANALMLVLPAHSPAVACAAMLALAVAVTPFVNNASTAIILGPVAVSMASAAGVMPKPLLIAVALGASIDFLTPIGHHNNTIVMGLAGYRFVDFVKAGWPVTVFVCLASIVAIGAFWI